MKSPTLLQVTMWCHLVFMKRIDVNLFGCDVLLVDQINRLLQRLGEIDTLLTYIYPYIK